MQKKEASELMVEILKMTDQLNFIIRKVESDLTGDELLVMRRHLGMVMVACDQHLFRPIVREYPDLDPHL
jgi:hypothetical protein